MRVNFFLKAALLLFLLISTSGCVYSKVRLPLDLDVDKTELGSKVGEASAQSVIWLFAWGDASTAAAAKNGSLQVINHLDSELYTVLFGLYTKNTTIAYGD